jgi:hypothetical protein
MLKMHQVHQIVIFLLKQPTMSKKLTPFILLLSAGPVAAQCTSSVPADAVVISSSTAGVQPQSGTDIWLCNEAFQQIFTGSNNNFWIEPNAFFNGINGNNNIIHYKGTAALGVFGSNNVIYASATTAIADQGSGNTINVCGANGVVFNYGSAPAGCGVSGVNEMENPAISLYYDRTADDLVVDDPDGHPYEVHVLDAAGRSLGQRNATQRSQWSMAQYPAGCYIVHVLANARSSTYRFVK